MKIMQVITDYIARSILTTQGDMVVRGASVPEKLTAPMADRWLKGTGTGVKPSWTAALGGVTTQGDLIVRGVSIAERLAAVAVGQVLKSAGVATKPAWEKPFMSDLGFVTGSYTRSTVGDEVITGTGFRPSLVIFIAADAIGSNLNSSIGFDNGGFHIKKQVGAMGSTVVVDTASSLGIARDGSNQITGSISTTSGDGFTVTHSLTGAAVMDVVWFAIG